MVRQYPVRSTMHLLTRCAPSPASAKEGKSQTDAVVTPPSTTMVWPVMKLEASEPR